jgi:hypothetical protein
MWKSRIAFQERLDVHFSFHRVAFSMLGGIATEWGLYGAIMLFWSLVGLICGFKFKSVRPQCWGVAPLCFIVSLFALNHWYNWEIDTPYFVCSECETKQIYVKKLRGGRFEHSESWSEVNCIECKTKFSSRRKTTKKPLPDPFWD